MTTNENIQYRADRRRTVQSTMSQVAAFAFGVGLVAVLLGTWVSAQFMAVHKVDRHPGTPGVEDVQRNEDRIRALESAMSKLEALSPRLTDLAEQISTVQQAVRLQQQTVTDALLQQREQLADVGKKLQRIEALMITEPYVQPAPP